MKTVAPITFPALSDCEQGGNGFLFAFELDLYPSMRCIPMVVRYKLDMVGLKVSLKVWNALPLDRRQELLYAWPVETAAERSRLREALCHWLQAVSNEPLREVVLEEPSPWQEGTPPGTAVREQGERCRPPLTIEEWGSLERLERFALVKLASSKHERGRFAAALAEFRQRRLAR
jgi:hypothetical protein